jgi:hypothetical protein
MSGPPETRADIVQADGGLIGVEVEVPHPDGFWWIYALVVPRDGRLVIAEIRIFPGQGDRHTNEWGLNLSGAPPIGEWDDPDVLQELPDPGLKSSALRRSLFTQLTKRAQQEINEAWDIPEMRGPLQDSDLREAATRPGRRGHPDLFWAQLAANYERAAAEHHNFNEVLARTYGEKPEKVAGWVHQARRPTHAFIEPSPSRQATAKARRVLEQHRREMRSAEDIYKAERDRMKKERDRSNG